MMKNLGLLLCFFTLAACSGGGGGGGATTTYKYQISGTSPLAFSIDDEQTEMLPSSDLEILSTSFILQWNEDGSGNITGNYINQTTGEAIPVTGISNGSGRTINATLAIPVGGATSIRFIIAQTGDLTGTISATLKTLDSGNSELSSQSISVTAQTTGGTGGGGGGGGTGTLASYHGLYTGTVSEVTNTALGVAVGNNKYCDLNFSGVDFKFELNANYLTLGYSAVYSSGGGAYVDVPVAADPANISINKNLGYFSATLTDQGYDYTGVKVKGGDTGKMMNVAFVGAFSGTTTKKFIGTMTITAASVSLCSFSLDLTKQ